VLPPKRQDHRFLSKYEDRFDCSLDDSRMEAFDDFDDCFLDEFKDFDDIGLESRTSNQLGYCFCGSE